MSGRQTFTVAQVNRYAKRLLEADALLGGLFVEGELSNFTAHTSGHMYFTMKDAQAAISAVMFRSAAQTLDFAPKSGMKVIAFGRLSIYEKTGQYQLYVEHMQPAGIGGLQLAFTQLCEKLRGEGLFDDARKRPIPRFARTAALITSPTGAAVQDMLRIARDKNPCLRLVVVPAQVQGEGAAQDLARAIADVNAWGGADVIILGRGGGSIEDLWAFNEEVTARAVAASRIPIISAVGHETDFVVTDFVADWRAPTPTAAAHGVAYDHAAAAAMLAQWQTALHQAAQDRICTRFAQAKQLLIQLNRHMTLRLAHEQQSLAHREVLLEKVSPYAAFRRGFALVRDSKQAAVTSPQGLVPGTPLTLEWAQGAVAVSVIGAVATCP